MFKIPFLTQRKYCSIWVRTCWRMLSRDEWEGGKYSQTTQLIRKDVIF